MVAQLSKVGVDASGQALAGSAPWDYLAVTLFLAEGQTKAAGFNRKLKRSSEMLWFFYYLDD